MLIRTCAFTAEGWEFIDRLERASDTDVFERKPEDEKIDSWVENSFACHLPILFVGAVGIAVRKIAPFIEGKLTDSPVVAADEQGRFVIPLLSNHVGGANEIAKRIAAACGGQVVITTATDLRHIFSVDVFAKRNGLAIVNKEGIRAVSAKLLKEGRITMAVDPAIEICTDRIPDSIQLLNYEEKTPADVVIEMKKSSRTASLTLIFKPYILGIGCKKNTEFEKMDAFLQNILKEKKIEQELVAGIASIDLKKKERALLYMEAFRKIPLLTYPAEELEIVQGEFSGSEFVKSITGVSNVCERAAMKAAGEGAEMMMPKAVHDGMTLAISKRKARIMTWET